MTHEIAHGWWRAAPVDSWEDWLNESFAEMSALLVIEALYGVDAYLHRMEQKRLHPMGTLPLWGFNRFDHTTPEKRELCEKLLSEKGSVCLHVLMERIEKEGFLLLCKRFQNSGCHTNDNFLDLIEAKHGCLYRAWIQEKNTNTLITKSSCCWARMLTKQAGRQS